jgi:signal transduction histidine kinase
LALSKIEAGKMEYYMKDIEIVPLLKSVYNDVFLEAKAKQVKFEIEIDKKLKEEKINIDEDKIKQVFINLI